MGDDEFGYGPLGHRAGRPGSSNNWVVFAGGAIAMAVSVAFGRNNKKGSEPGAPPSAQEGMASKTRVLVPNSEWRDEFVVFDLDLGRNGADRLNLRFFFVQEMRLFEALLGYLHWYGNVIIS